jgi:type I restriction-modification system DNA methylase subunit
MADYVARLMLRYVEEKSSGEVSILDPAVGEGELLIAMINAVKDDCNMVHVVGYETDREVAKHTQAKLEKLFPNVDVSIRIEDFLSAVEDGTAGKYDFVIANPPYIRTQILGSEKAQGIAEKLSLT